MPFNLGTIFAEIGLNTQKLDQGLMAAQTKLATADNQINTMGQRLTANSTKFMMAGGLMVGAVAGIGIASVKMASQFETSMYNVNSISKLSEAQFKKQSDAVLTLSTKLPQSAKVLADGLYDIASSGFAGADGLKVLEASAKAASAGMTDTATSAKGITAVLNTYGFSAEEAGRVSDTMFKTVDKGVITFEELSSTIGDSLGMAKAAGLSFEELSGAIAYMTIKGLNASEAGTAVSRLMTSMLKPTDDLAQVFKNTGYESGEMALKQLGLAGTLKLVQDATGGSITKMLELIPEIRAVKGANALLGAGYEELTGFMSDFKDTADATDVALKEQSKSLDFQMKLLKNNANAVVIALGSELIPSITKYVTGLTKFIQTHKEATVTLIKYSGAILGAAGSVLLLAGAVGKLRALWLSSPTTVIIAGILAIGTAIDLTAGKLDEMNTKWGEFGSEALRAINPLPWKQVGYAVTSLSDTIKVYQALAEGTIEITDLQNLGMHGTIEKMKELKAAEEETMISTYGAGEAFKSAQIYIKNYSDELPIASSLMIKLIQDLQDGTLSTEGFAIGVDELRDATKNGRIDIEETTYATGAMGEKFDAFTKQQLREYIKAMGEGKIVTEEVALSEEELEKAAEETKEALDNLNDALESGAVSPKEYIRMLSELGLTLNQVEGGFNAIIEAAFKFYNNQYALEESTKKYKEKLKKLDEMQKTHTVTTGGGNEAILANINAQENLTKANENYQKVISNTESTEKQILEATIAKTNAQKGADDAAKGIIVTTKSYTASQEDLDKQIKVVNDDYMEMLNWGMLIYNQNTKALAQGDLIAEQEAAAIEQNKILQKGFIESGLKAVEFKTTSLESFIAMAIGFGLSGRDILDTAEEMEIDLTKYFQEAADNGIDSFVELCKSFGLQGQQIIDKGEEVGLELDYDLRERTVVIGVDATGVPKAVQSVLDDLGRIKDKTVKITVRKYYEALGAVSGKAMGGIVGYDTGGIVGMPDIPQAAGGMVVPQTGRVIPILAHEGEMILNDSQQGNLINALWGVANGKGNVSRDKTQPILIQNILTLDGRTIYEETNKYLFDETKGKLIGKGIKI